VTATDVKVLPVATNRGTKALIPATCTTGDGYWVTDEGYWNSKNDSPTVTADGVLYKCTATDTWTPYYIPLPIPAPAAERVERPHGRNGAINGTDNLGVRRDDDARLQHYDQRERPSAPNPPSPRSCGIPSRTSPRIAVW